VISSLAQLSSSASSRSRSASGEPQWPSATATLRSSPRRLVPFTAEPLKRREKFSCDIPISSTSAAPTTPACGYTPYTASDSPAARIDHSRLQALSIRAQLPVKPRDVYFRGSASNPTTKASIGPVSL
jgi:hypothetical protein